MKLLYKSILVFCLLCLTFTTSVEAVVAKSPIVSEHLSEIRSTSFVLKGLIHEQGSAMENQKQLAGLNAECTAISIKRIADKSVFRELDEVLTITATIKNTGTTLLENIILEDELAEGAGWSSGKYTIPSIASQEELNIVYTIKVTQVHIAQKEVISKLVIDDSLEPNNQVEDILAIGYYNIVLENFNDKEYYFKEDGEVIWTIKLTNNGRDMIEDLEIYASIANGPGWSKGKRIINIFEAGQTLEFTYKSPIYLHALSGTENKSNYYYVIDPLFPEIEIDIDNYISIEGLSLSVYVDQFKFSEIGQQIEFTISVNNSWRTARKNIIIEDPKGNGPGWVDGKYIIPSIDVHSINRISYMYEVTNADFLTQEINHKVVVKDPAIPSFEKDARVVIPKGRISLTDYIFNNYHNYREVGDVVYFSYGVYNHTNQYITGLVIDNDKGVELGWGGTQYVIPYIAPFSMVNVPCVLNVTQQHIDDKLFKHKGVLTDPADPSIREESEVAFYYYNWSVERTADKNIYYQIGDEIVHTGRVINSGGLDLVDVTAVDETGRADDWGGIGLIIPLLKAGEIYEYTNTQKISALDIRTKYSYSSLSAVNETVNMDPRYSPGSAKYSGYSVEKSANVSRFFAAGESILYTLTIYNEGLVDLKDLEVVDPAGNGPGWSNGRYIIPELKKEDKIQLVYSYIVTEEDVNNKVIENSVRVSDPLSPIPYREAFNALPLHGYLLNKTANKPIFKEEGEEILYTITVKNEGLTTLDRITLDDPMATGDGWKDGKYILCNLLAGTFVDIVYTYKVTAADIYNQEIVNKVKAHDSASPNNPQEVELVLKYVNVEFTKESDRSYFTRLDEDIAYLVTIRNNGKSTLHDILITDAMGNGAGWVDGVYRVAELPVGLTLSIRYQHRVTELDIANKEVLNKLHIADLNGFVDPDSLAVVTTYRNFSIIKTADKTHITAMGEQITYKVTIQNIGAVDIDNILVEDALGNGLGWVDGKYTIPLLAAGATVDIAYSYTVTAADITLKNVRNIAKATDPLYPELAKEADVILYYQELAISKQADKSVVRHAGEFIHYIVSVTNNGAMDLENMLVEDALGNGLGWVDGKYTIPLLVAGATVDIAYSYTVTAADIDLKSIHNTAKVVDPLYPLLAKEASVRVAVSNFALQKTANRSMVSQVGEVIQYTISLENTGAVDLANLLLEDAMATGTGWQDGKYVVPLLEVGAKLAISYDYIVRAADLMHKELINVAKASDSLYPHVGKEASTIVKVSVRLLEAVDDGPVHISGVDGGNTISVLANDRLDGQAINPTMITLRWDVNNPVVKGVLMNADGTISVSPATLAGTYLYRYTICERTNLNNCASAQLTMIVSAATLNAVDDHFELKMLDADQFTASVLLNDKLQGEPLDPTKIILTAGLAADPNLQMQADGSIKVLAGIKAGTYTYSYSICERLNPDNCSQAIATVLIKASALFIPNAFTPNGDGINDVFELVGMENYDAVKVQIMNRWGNEVYRSDKYTNTWSGNGLSEGTYYYSITLVKAGVEEQRKGWVLLKVK